MKNETQKARQSSATQQLGAAQYALLFFILLTYILLCAGCNKKEAENDFNVTLEVIGSGNYQYQIGSKTGSGHATSYFVQTGIAHRGDLVSIKAQGDSLATAPFQKAVKLKFSSDPIVGGQNRETTGTNPGLVYQY